MKSLAIVCRHVHGVGGATSIILDHARQFSASGWEVHIFAERLDFSAIKAAGAVGHYIPHLRVGSTSKRWLFAQLALLRVKCSRFDLLNGHGDIFSQDVLTLHNCVHAAHEAVSGQRMPDKGVAWIHRRLLTKGKYKHIIANSELMKRDLVKRFGLNPSLISVVYPGYRPERSNYKDRLERREEARTKLGVEPGRLLIGLVSSGDLKKRGLDIFLETLGRLPEQMKEKVQALVVGAGTVTLNARKSETLPHIKFLRPLKQISDYLYALDIFFYPARFEEFGIVVLEAMAAGLPVLTSLQVGASELFPAETRALLPSLPTADAFLPLLYGLITVESQRQLWCRLSLKAAEGRSSSSNFQRTAAIFEEVLRQREASGQRPGKQSI